MWILEDKQRKRKMKSNMKSTMSMCLCVCLSVCAYADSYVDRDCYVTRLSSLVDACQKEHSKLLKPFLRSGAWPDDNALEYKIMRGPNDHKNKIEYAARFNKNVRKFVDTEACRNLDIWLDSNWQCTSRKDRYESNCGLIREAYCDPHSGFEYPDGYHLSSNHRYCLPEPNVLKYAKELLAGLKAGRYKLKDSQDAKSRDSEPLVVELSEEQWNVLKSKVEKHGEAELVKPKFKIAIVDHTKNASR